MSAPSSDRAAIRQILRTLKAGGFIPTLVWDGEDSVPFSDRATEASIIEACTATDESALHVRHADGRKGCVYFVLGNEPFEVASDYTTNLDGVLEPLFDKWDA